MSEIHAFARTNYFYVKDRDAFVEEFADLDITVIDESDTDGQPTGRVALLADGENGWPVPSYDSDTGDVHGAEVSVIVSRHLADNSIAYGLEVGEVKSQRVMGNAWAVDGSEFIYMDLEDHIRNVIHEKFNPDPNNPVTYARY